MRRAFQTDRLVTLFGKHLEIAPWPAAEFEYREGRHTFDVLQQRLNVLADVRVYLSRILRHFDCNAPA
jgi:hypothetical protein